ncbi:MAG: preprotein translocase subunit SecE [Chloroflexi bacterium]|nr:preprotein translocase subunit SecE [Chloroflexota bacterium]MXX66461.1 preprotein translocase subunit SecE [Chloroflexota bacterium]MXX99811.1 preprotein translocase subunit SecE [Chloroflexota bacterium]MYB15709.1 preprotein translocase subunit SecE [Chloroflexota bacterium]MYC47306.1 preprotein translocase subunit SecE [Chloroflexota bacterium]
MQEPKLAGRRRTGRREARKQGTNPAAFARETVTELRRSHWPTRDETVRLTVIVLGVVIALAAFLGLFDFGLARLSDLIFLQN